MKAVEILQKWKCTVSYDGTAYAGFQLQQQQKTIQGTIEKALADFHGQEVKIFASGRTDAGVHAKGQVFHFESSLELQSYNWIRVLNTRLPGDIRLVAMEQASQQFHARYDVQEKEYRYFIHYAAHENPLRRLYTYHVREPLDLELMKEAASFFIGEHDFTAFSSAKSTKENRVRTIRRLEIEEDGEELVVICAGNGFLQHMVRIIVGTLIAIGQGKIPLGQIEEAFLQKERSLAGKTAAAKGLCLWKVSYS